MARCLLHPEPLEVPDSRGGGWMFEHLRRSHPDVYGRGPDRWALTGDPVVYDQTVQPQDLQGLRR
jgi:hypothetical protein